MNKLLDCIINKNSSEIPIWFMRQAGRYLPEFREIRKKNTDFIKLCLNKKLVLEITLQPLTRFNLDAAIIFSDILMIPYGLNQQVEFKKGIGPILGNIDIDKILSTKSEEFVKKINPVYDAINDVSKKTKSQSVIGFVGAPWTLLVYMINKQSPKENFTLSNVLKEKSSTEKILKKIEETVCLHAAKQIEAGANVIQVFDSWAGLLPQNELEKYCFTPNQKIVEHIKTFNVPVICFPRGIGKNYVDFCSVVKPNCISIDYEVDPKLIKNKIKEIAVQGGLDPKVLLKDNESIKKEVQNYLNIFSDHPYVFNLGHGVLPETKPETIQYVIDLVRSFK